MKEKIANAITLMAKKAARKTVGKSFLIGSYEIKPPRELLDKKGCTKNEHPMQ